ncbi:MAG: ATP-dependent DNA helicase RecG [Candidatus Dojkabacteria bacterium]
MPFVGSKYSTLLLKLDVRTIGDLLHHFPKYYKDTREISTIAQLSSDEKRTVIATLTELRSIRLKGRRTMQKGIIEDETGAIEVVWFNQPYLTKNLRLDSMFMFSGKLEHRSSKPQLSSPEYEVLRGKLNTETIHMGRVAPVYSLTTGISSKWLRARVNWLIKNIRLIDDLEDHLSIATLKKYSLLGLQEALKLIHFPETRDNIIQSRRRLGLDELVSIQRKLIKIRRQRKRDRGPKVEIDQKAAEKSIRNLEFELTQSQKSAYKQIYTDLSGFHPMHRLLQGDTGSGKTVIAALAALQVVRSQLQVVVLAPTTILAAQLFHNFREFLPATIKCDLITGKTDQYRQSTAEIDILIGTHALLHRKEDLITDLGLLIIDEQHRFGVKQKRELEHLKDTKPHVLHLTATPIPRTIALTLFGDQDLSRIEKPDTRQTVNSFVVPEQKREQSLNWIESLIRAGGQAFWVHPVIEDKPESTIKSAKKAFSQLKKMMPVAKFALLHGKMKEEEKKSIIENFKRGIYNVLISTTVIEVGIDIPGANLMIIEGAERFGLAQLHQLRGRVGRRDQESWCLLFTTNENNQDAISRLTYFAKQSDGIKIAEYDLNRRGPGEVYGTIQSGIPDLKIATFSNLKLLEQAREIASETEF